MTRGTEAKVLIDENSKENVKENKNFDEKKKEVPDNSNLKSPRRRPFSNASKFRLLSPHTPHLRSPDHKRRNSCFESSHRKLSARDTAKETVPKSVLKKLWRDWDKVKIDENVKEAWVFHPTPPPTDYYTIGSVIGTPGQYGVVRRCVCKETGQAWAIKSIQKKTKNEIIEQFCKDLRFETYLMFTCKGHDNIVELHEVFESEDHVYLVMELLTGGDLFEYIQKMKGKSDEKQVARVFAQALNSVYFIHRLNIVHCDLKPENFVFDGNGVLKLIDFGMSKVARWRRHFKRMNGTPYYIAPEVLRGKYNKSCDMWSLGICLYVLVFGVPPFYCSHRDKQKALTELYRMIVSGFEPRLKKGLGPWFPEEIPVTGACRDLITRLLRKSTADRITACEAIAHQWFQSNLAVDEMPMYNLQIIDSIQTFVPGSQFRKELISLLKDVRFLNIHQEAEVLKSLENMDQNGDGLIDRDELYIALNEIEDDVSIEKVEEIISRFGKHGTEGIALKDFLSACILQKIVSKEERIQKLFKIIDQDRDGLIDALELHTALQTTRESSLGFCKELITNCDYNHDGKIDYEEFLAMFHARERDKFM